MLPINKASTIKLPRVSGITNRSELNHNSLPESCKHQNLAFTSNPHVPVEYQPTRFFGIFLAMKFSAVLAKIAEGSKKTLENNGHLKLILPSRQSLAPRNVK